MYDKQLNVSSQWPRPGHAFTYKTKFVLDGFEPFDFELSVPSQAEQLDLSNLVYGRIGGPTTADVELRKELYYVIGTITVASGHIEAAMKRLILVLQGKRKRQFSLVDKTWTDLHKILTSACKKSDADPGLAKMRQALTLHLQWAERCRIKEHRDNFIHGSICDFAMPAVLLSRFYRKQDGQQILFKLEQIQEIAQNLEEYARRLESLLQGVWHEAMLPEYPQVPGYTTFTPGG